MHYVFIIPTEVKKVIGSPGTDFIGDYKPQCGSQRPNTDPLRELLVFLTPVNIFNIFNTTHGRALDWNEHNVQWLPLPQKEVHFRDRWSLDPVS